MELGLNITFDMSVYLQKLIDFISYYWYDYQQFQGYAAWLIISCSALVEITLKEIQRFQGVFSENLRSLSPDIIVVLQAEMGFLWPISSIEASFVKGWLECDTSCNAWFSYKWGQFNCVRMFWCHILRIIPLTCLKPKFFFANFKFEFYNLIRLSYLIFCCKRTKSWTSSLRKSFLILTRSDFEEVNVVTCWDKKNVIRIT